ncbi:asparagine synthase-related protein [Actinoplanes sp. RD1]|uniref:asparagine synthase-related protein n=1 Tax=Actinoplanes sp. RD1 TaxID=3064538 RepID=UPI0027421E8F|nr:asparagine synthase-related protein [Actinoplanes sp. RD1]
MVSGTGWHVIALPDHPAADELAQRLGDGHTVVRHASGRPWLLHTHPADQVAVSALVGRTRVAVIGFSDADAAALTRAAHHEDGPETLARTRHGGFGVLATRDGAIGVLSSATGARRFATARIGGVRIAADRADVLARIGSLPFDDTTIALRTVRSLPYPCLDEPLWRGVEPVRAGEAAWIDAAGERVRRRRWWTPPAAELGIAAGARRLRDTLAAAVATRTAAGGVIHADLSGGFDSTPLTYFAARGPATVLAGTAYNDDPGGREDLMWARKALPALPCVQHRVFSLDGLPGFYAGLSAVRTCFDEPSDALRAAPRMAAMITGARELGARAYLTGLGGDHLLTSMPAWDHTILRRHPVTALRRVRALQLLEDMPARTAFGPLFRSESYGTWLRRTIAAMGTRDEFAEPTLRISWGHRMYWPPWLSSGHRAAVQARLLAIAATAEPLSPALGEHAYLRAIRDGATVARAAAQLGADLGVAFEAPFFDDRVVEACLAVRLPDRSHPRRFKPLMREAMRGLLPDDFLRRSRKTGGTAQAVRGLRAGRAELQSLCHHSYLAEHHIIDRDVLAARAFPGERWVPVRDLDATLTCALFTRNHGDATAAKGADRADHSAR